MATQPAGTIRGSGRRRGPVSPLIAFLTGVVPSSASTGRRAAGRGRVMSMTLLSVGAAVAVTLGVSGYAAQFLDVSIPADCVP